ncbi:GTPase-activating protein and VPS9 domain-containing protein 1 [Parasteatoda tepidariorum]|uniref:GTPase-activating protein and VPS9 domain-containing protein 1 n=1 Tax=Parasteatoda tepidariorum TaxID=114398 RepID=UPI00077FDE99|nr:GTPase-activating protein and VPS9 domain-containing protein 1 [Parasteatoda tepidariorum]
MSSRMDLMDLARHLRQESLFVNSEKQNLQNLNEKVMKAAENLYHLSWIARQQRQILDSLLLSHTDMNLSACYQRSNGVEGSNFIDSYKHLGINDCNYSEFLQQLRENPKIIAACLYYGEKIDINTMHNVVNIVMTAIYGNCILPEDEVHALTLLKELMSLQLAISDNPRRLLRHGSCAFSRVYKIFSECLFSAKIFLTAALHEPIMHLLMADDLFLDIDPSKAAVRFHPQERLRHFGKEGTPEYAASLQRYRNWTISKLVSIANRFIEEIRNNLYCFPQSLSWLARQMYNIVMKAKRVEVREVGAMCADLVFAFFICPAIVDPESYGITDIPISYIARFNLMQVAQILQVLAMSKWEEIDPKLMDLYGKFEKDCMSSLLDLILEGSATDSPADLVNQFQDLNRSAVLITESELLSLVSFLRSVEAESSDTTVKKTLYAMINHLPTTSLTATSLLNGNGGHLTPGTSTSDTHPLTPSTKRSFLGKVGRKSTKLANTISQENHVDEANGLSEVDSGLNSKNHLEDVLVVPILGLDFDCPGMLNEEKVLAIESQKKKQSLENGCLLEESDALSVGPEPIEKRTRFSLSQDQESVGTSDNLEAISEAASNHSVASSLDLENENENDNLSDMVSANVSGRGTPNVSGRDTPSSQLEGEEREQRPLDLMASSRKQNQEDIEDKFGKFEIQPMNEGDETKSMVSDTWSTDVLASDSETVEQSDMSSQVTLDSQSCLDRGLLDASETASQSDAWSVDVLASDTERLQDLDTDDTASVARSDDTARSEVDGEMGAGVDDARLDRKDILDSDGMRDPFLPDAYGIVGGNQNFIPPHTTNFSGDIASFQTNYSHFTSMNEESSVLSEKGVRLRHKTTLHESSLDSFKSPELLHMDLESDSNVSTLVDGQSALDESLSSMQSLGRVSLAVRELPDASDQDSGVMLLDSLQETVSSQNSQQTHRSSIVDILSLDLTRTLNLPAAACPPAEFFSNSSSPMQFDKDTPTSKTQVECSTPIEPIKPGTIPRNSVGERGAKRKLQDFGPEEVCPQFRAVSLSNNVNSEGSYHQNASATSADHSEAFNSRHMKAISVPISTGAISKSISFHKHTEDMDLEMDDKFGGDKHRKSLFKLSGFRFTFKGKNRKSHPSYRGDTEKDNMNDLEARSRGQPQSSLAEIRAFQLEASDEILAKYRKKAPSSAASSSLKSSNSEISETMSNASDNVLMDNNLHNFDSVNMENSIIFSDAKCKLRLVLGSADLQTLPWLSHSRGRSISGGLQRLQENELVAFLKVLLAEAINLQQRPLMAHLHEALRCVRLFDDIGCQKLFKSLRDDYRKRAPYIAYLVRCRQGLLSTLSHLETLTERVERDKQVSTQYLVMTSVRIFLEKHDRHLQYFVRTFQELVVADEKAIKVEEFLTHLFNGMQSDAMWQTASEIQIEHAKAVIEHSVMSRIYTFALHPNGDGDVLRDKVLHEHMQKLSQVITPDHKDLRIPKIYHSECPWPSAQAELVNINAYKTPRDKIQCVLRCCNTIMNLLSMASNKSVPAADDLMPVLVYVLIKANPPHLLSTVQYVNTFYEKQLEGEEAYWWTQFASGVEFIKNMDYS